MKKLIFPAVVLITLFLLAGCAPGANQYVMPENEEAPGFWLGLWQGFISPITFVISLFNDSIGIYEVNNSGNWYNFGFILGVAAFFGGSGGGAGRARRG